jgi:hypothetical protein
MNSQLGIVVLIDVEAALNANSLHGNAFLIDNYRFMGSTGQGTEQLTTAVVGAQIVNWLATGIDLSGQQPYPFLEKIGGEAVEKQIMVPQLFDSPVLDDSRGLWWGATVDASIPGKYSYTLSFDIAGKKMELVPSINVQTGFTMFEKLQNATAQRTVSATLAQAKTQALRASSVPTPGDHLSFFPMSQLNKMRSLLNKINR